MGEKLQCYAVSTWANMRNADYNLGLDAAIDHLRSLQRQDLEEVIDALTAMKAEVDTSRLPA